MQYFTVVLDIFNTNNKLNSPMEESTPIDDEVTSSDSFINPAIIPVSQSYAGEVFFGVLFVAAMAVFIVKLTKRSLQWDTRHYYALNKHHWCYTGLFMQPSHCSVCEAVVVTSGGAFCDCCGLCTDHEKCMVKADQDQPCKLITSTADATLHHWVKGNLPLSGCSCSVCNRDCGEGVGLRDYQCVWCDSMAHGSCRASMTQECQFGPYRQFVVPPHCVQLGRARLRGALTVRRVTRPCGVRDWMPVMVIGNVYSGSSEAQCVLSQFRRVLNPLQVLDVSTVPVEEAVRWCRLLDTATRSNGGGGGGDTGSGGGGKVKLIVAGGDGTIGWVLNTLHKKKLMQTVQVALVPLGTGNDLSRVLGWGPALDGPMDAAGYLRRLTVARPATLDRWLVKYTPAPALHSINILPAVMPTREVFMNNYLSIGVDALVTLRFHQARQSPFYLFNSRLINKLIYFGYGTADVLQHSCERLHEHLSVVMDGRRVSLPPLEALLVLNIPSWGAGVRPWTMGAVGKMAEKQDMSDGLLEVLCISSSFHICQLQMGLSEPTRLGQCRRIEVAVRGRAVPMQVDGEPWEQQPGAIIVSHSHTATMLTDEA